MSGMKDLGDLLCKLNPYGRRYGLDEMPAKWTGDMDIYVGYPNPANPAGNDLSQVELEVDTKYPADWDFKNAKHRVNTAVRIKYRYPVYHLQDVLPNPQQPPGGTNLPNPEHLPANAKPIYWIEDYLLIGFEGAGGG
ncbi:MAG TPA: hypothetical protein VMH36_06955 [Alphaproteobacteria bacterium]|nr:hypothetical protein [Alphaproteobacteria bacterium]